MKLIQFKTLDSSIIYINPAHVESVFDGTNYSKRENTVCIFTIGSSEPYVVLGSVVDVVDKINNRLCNDK